MGAIPEYDPEEPQETKPFKFVTAGAYIIDFLALGNIPGMLRDGLRCSFPQMNQTKHCWQNYVDYYKCVNAKGEDFRPCRQFYHAFRALCPKAWTDRWDGQREAGNFPAHLDR
ncbi:cytochrome c oxidase polypeptide vib [Penicillium verhagenii]|nr:cytochrome c oxidase polypeptide vib [Penicillium verhagenii]